MVCKFCGKEIPRGSRVCLYCGKSVAVEPAAASPAKRTLYRATQTAPLRPTVQDAQKSDIKKTNLRRKRLIAKLAAGVVALAILVAGGYAVGGVIKGGDTTPPDVSGAEPSTEPSAAPPSAAPSVKPSPSPSPAAYPIEGAWQWASDNDGYRDTVWLFKDGLITVYYIGTEPYAYDKWPTTYEYDESTGILTMKGGAYHLVWDSAEQFSIGLNVAVGIGEALIPADAEILNDAAPEPDVPEPDAYIFPDSDSRYLTEDDLAGLDHATLVLGRNEIFARHGRLFDLEEIQDYFDKQDWYRGYIKPANFSASVLNIYERTNISFIKSHEGE